MEPRNAIVTGASRGIGAAAAKRVASVVRVGRPQKWRANDVDPMWMGDAIYFRSDRNGEFNIFSYNLKTKAIKRMWWPAAS